MSRSGENSSSMLQSPPKYLFSIDIEISAAVIVCPGFLKQNLQSSIHRWLGWSSHQPSVWWSKYYFDRLKIKQWVFGLDLEHSKLLVSFFVKEFCKKLWKIIILGTSDTWSMSLSPWWTNEPAEDIVDCRIFSPEFTVYIFGQ